MLIVRKILWTDEHVLLMSVSARSTTVVCGYEIVLVLSSNVGYHVRFSVSGWPRISGDKVMGPYSQLCRLTAQRYRNYPETVLSGLFEDVPLVTEQNL
jgi:hypothetical protein